MNLLITAVGGLIKILAVLSKTDMAFLSLASCASSCSKTAVDLLAVSRGKSSAGRCLSPAEKVLALGQGPENGCVPLSDDFPVGIHSRGGRGATRLLLVIHCNSLENQHLVHREAEYLRKYFSIAENTPEKY